MPNRDQREKNYVAIDLQEKNNANPKIKFAKMLSITEQYQRKVSPDKLVYSDDLMKAISKNDVAWCFELIQNEYTLDDLNTNYFFHPLLLAAKKGSKDILEILLNKGCDINTKDKKGFTSLHYSLQQRNIDCCDFLINKDINVKISDKYGNVPLHIAASEGLLDIVNILIGIYEDVNIRNKKDQTPLHHAAIKGNSTILESLIRNGGRWDLKDVNFWLPIHFAAFHGQHVSCKVLSDASEERVEEHLRSCNKDNATPLILAAKKGHSRCCQNLSKSDIDFSDHNGNTALHFAATLGFLKTIEVLLSMKPDATIQNKDGNTPTHKAALQRNLDCVKLMIEYNSEPGLNFSGQSVLHLAAINNCNESLSYLLQIGNILSQINIRDKNGKTALHTSLNNGNVESAEVLIEAGIDTTLADENGNLPLHIAACNNLKDLCKILLSGTKVGTVNERNNIGTTALHFAAMNASEDCCKFLLMKGADLNALDSNGFSPLHVACHIGNLDVIKYFVKKSGGFLNQLVETTGDTTLHLSARNGSQKCCEFILKHIKKDSIMKLNNNDNSVLDETFSSGHDQIFYLILSKISAPTEKHKMEQYLSLQSCLHEYMHEALQSHRTIIIKAILESDWWYAGLSSNFCPDGQCNNLVSLTHLDANLAEIAYHKSIEVNESSTRFNFKIFENSFYLPTDKSGENGQGRASPFESHSGSLLPAAELYKQQGPHPLEVAAEGEYLNLMMHPLTVAYLKYKWIKYIRIISALTVFCEFFLVLLIGLYLNYVENYSTLLQKNITKSQLCTDKEMISTDMYSRVTPNYILCHVIYTILVVSVIGLFITEINLCRKGKYSFFNLVQAARIYRLIGIFLLVIPVNLCEYDIIVKETWQWEVGIICLILSWFHMIHEINTVPFLSVFMPVTKQFIYSFLKVVMYIILILFIFAFCFHLLLRDKPAFENLPGAFIKTIVWVLGDLAYDDTFVDKESIIMYPTMTTVIFLLLVTSISGFIANLIITQPSDHSNVFREKAIVFKESSRIKLFLRLDTIFDIFRKRYLVEYWEVPHNHDQDMSTSPKIPLSPSNISSISKVSSELTQDTSYNYTIDSLVARLENLENLVLKQNKILEDLLNKK